MGYDYKGGSSSPVGSVAPLGGPGYDIGDTIRAYVRRIPASKVILGVPYYGRAWSTSTSALGSKNISGTKYGASTTVVYSTAREYAADHGKRWDPVQAVAWTVYRRENCTTTYGCVKPWRQLYYDDAKALGLKYDAVNRYNLRGAGIWALGYDGTRTELYSVLKAKFITDTVPPMISAASLSSTLLSPNGDGRMDTATVASDGHRPPPLRLGRPAVLRRDRRPGAAVRERRRQERWPSPGTARTRPASRGPRRPVPDHRLDRRRLEQPGVDQQGRDGRPARGGRHPRPPSPASSRPTATATRIGRSCPGRPTSGSPGRPASSTRTARPSAAGRRRRDRRVLDLERPEHRRDDGRRRPLHVPRDGPRPGRQPDRPRPDRPRRPDDPLGDLGEALVHAAGRPEGPADVRPAPEGDRHRRHLPGLDAGPPDLDGPRPRGRHVRLDVERQDRRRRVRQARDVQGRSSTRRAGSGRPASPAP